MLASKNNKRQAILEGKTKVFYQYQDLNHYIMHFKDDIELKNDKSGIISGKGVINNKINELIMTRLNEAGLQTHFVKILNMKEQLVKITEVIPVKIVIRNVVAGSLSRKFDIVEGLVLNNPLIEYYYNESGNKHNLVSEEHILTLGFANPFEFEEIRTIALRVNDFLQGFFAAAGIRLIDFKLEFGRVIEDDIYSTVIIDEISPDTCRLWDIKTNEKLDKDRFKLDMEGVQEAYREVAKRLGVLPSNINNVETTN
ncbi:MAG: phosphoribosylaminoimidazolesuccinocarboxamide synthase [Sphingobacteriia bacterium]|nr:phosphoribosylaminoimidazolesuccinocarboxamide synthase [Sphingobacteriia bacterium]